jgi:Ca2+-binding EF-hand superfamily protein
MPFPRLFLPLAVVAVVGAAPARAEEPLAATSRFFDAYDRNGDGQVTEGELGQGGEIFRLLDKDHDGVITGPDLGLPADFRPRPPAPDRGGRTGGGAPGGGGGERARRLAERLGQLDGDGDGAVTLEEWQGPPELFARLDQDRNGRLDGKDVEALTRLGRGPDPEAVQARFRDLDRNGDGALQSGELPRPDALPQLDANGDGGVDLQEFEAGMRRLGGDGRDRGLDAASLRRFDQDKDGRCTRDEFPGSDERFDRLDRDGDGVLTTADIAPPTAPPAERPTTPRPAGLVAEHDRDGNGKLSRDEFAGTDDEWRRLDQDQDGWITPGEAGADAPQR